MACFPAQRLTSSYQNVSLLSGSTIFTMRFQRPLLLFYILLSASHVSSTVVVQNATVRTLSESLNKSVPFLILPNILSKPTTKAWTVRWSHLYPHTRHPRRHLQESNLQRLGHRWTPHTRGDRRRRRQPIPTKRGAEIRGHATDKRQAYIHHRRALQVFQSLGLLFRLPSPYGRENPRRRHPVRLSLPVGSLSRRRWREHLNRCTITVAGFEANNDEEVALASFTFTPPLEPLTSVPTIHAVLPATFLLPLSNVTIVQSNELADLKVDSLRYDVSTWRRCLFARLAWGIWELRCVCCTGCMNCLRSREFNPWKWVVERR